MSFDPIPVNLRFNYPTGLVPSPDDDTQAFSKRFRDVLDHWNWSYEQSLINLFLGTEIPTAIIGETELTALAPEFDPWPHVAERFDLDSQIAQETWDRIRNYAERGAEGPLFRGDGYWSWLFDAYPREMRELDEEYRDRVLGADFELYDDVYGWMEGEPLTSELFTKLYAFTPHISQRLSLLQPLFIRACQHNKAGKYSKCLKAAKKAASELSKYFYSVNSDIDVEEGEDALTCLNESTSYLFKELRIRRLILDNCFDHQLLRWYRWHVETHDHVSVIREVYLASLREIVRLTLEVLPAARNADDLHAAKMIMDSIRQILGFAYQHDGPTSLLGKDERNVLRALSGARQFLDWNPRLPHFNTDKASAIRSLRGDNAETTAGDVDSTTFEDLQDDQVRTKALALIYNDAESFDASLARRGVRSRICELVEREANARSIAVAWPKLNNSTVFDWVSDTLSQCLARPDASSMEHRVADREYEEILQNFIVVGERIERSPHAFSSQNEEELRFHFLVAISPEYSATAETFNHFGKTDIFVKIGPNRAMVTECKIWRGESYLLEAIDQLCSYATWHDTKLAMLVFNRNRDFSSVVTKIKTGSRQFPKYLRDVPFDFEAGYRFEVSHPDDDARVLTITVLAFNVPRSSNKC